jgi:MOSC domain-containing protein YiiM
VGIHDGKARFRPLAMTGRLDAINTSRGGVPKLSVFEALVTVHGLDGDRQRDTRFHGGPDRAIVLYSTDVIHALQREGHPIAIGAKGKNLTLAGIDWTLVTPGIEILVGGARLLVTKYVTPCTKVGWCFRDDEFARIEQRQHPGWSRVAARVLGAGLVRVGDSITLSPEP